MSAPTSNHLPTIVYVEDNAADAFLLEEALRERGHAVQLQVIANGEQALRYFQVKATARDLPPPHCILLDSRLPVVTGAELLRFVRGSQVYDATPVYIFAAEEEYRDLLRAGLVSHESFITKSSNWDGFLQLGDLLMRSASAKQDGTAANATGCEPEARAEGALRRNDTQAQRDTTEAMAAAKTDG